MRTFKKWMAVLLVVALAATSLMACGGGKSGSEAAGSYKVTEVEYGGTTISVAEFAESAGVELDVTMELKEDGSASMDMMGDVMEGGSWEVDGSTITITFEGDSAEGSYEDGKITIEEEGMKMTFEKQ